MGQCGRILGLTLWNMGASGEQTIMANARCLRTIMATTTVVAVPAAIGIDRNNMSIAMPVMLAVAANTAHFRCLLFIARLGSPMAHTLSGFSASTWRLTAPRESVSAPALLPGSP